MAGIVRSSPAESQIEKAMSKALPDPKQGLLEAGIGAIGTGIEDFAGSGRARRAAAIRNLYAGILLLCKHLLVTMAPQDDPLLLISAKTKFVKDETGRIRQAADSRMTIGVNEIIKRFNDLDLGIDVTHLQNLRRLRNEIEHYFSRARDEDFEEAFIEVQLLVSDLIARIDPSISLGVTWNEMVRRSRAFQQRRAQSRADLAAIKWISACIADLLTAENPYVECPECGSSHVARKDTSVQRQADVSLKCLQCSADVPLADMLETMLEFRFGGEDFEAAKCGELFQVYECPECNHQTYVMSEDCCAHCGANTDDYTCEHCHGTMPIWGVVDGNVYCSDECAHIAYQISKDD